jgi:hypothetical protein
MLRKIRGSLNEMLTSSSTSNNHNDPFAFLRALVNAGEYV